MPFLYFSDLVRWRFECRRNIVFLEIYVIILRIDFNLEL